MKLRYVLTAVMALATLSVAFWLSGPSNAQAQSNLLTNPGFEGGHFNQDNISEITVPNGWRMHWLDGIPFNNSNGNAARPETVVWNIQDAPPDERPLFFRDGAYTLKIFKGWAPVYAALSQDVTGLEVGRRYRLSAPIFVDIVESYEGGKNAPGKLDSGQVRLGAGNTGVAWRDAANIQYSPWWTGGNVPSFYLNTNTFSHEFTATSPNMTVWIEVASIDPYINNGFFMDGLSLVALDAVAPVAPPPAAGGGTGAVAAQPAGPTAVPPPTPTPRADGAVVHIVQAGDSFWGLAIQYASVMQLSPEDAVKAIQERNNNPTVINPGQELIIVPPNSSAAVAPPPAEETPEAETEAETEAVEEEVVAEEEATSEPEPENTASVINGICASVYHDLNGDAQRDSSNEPLLANAAITIFQGGRTVTSYVTDGQNEPYCFEDLPADTYQVQVYPPAGYQATTPESWAIVVAEGVIVPVAFGLAEAPETVAMVDDSALAEEVEAAAVEETAVSPNPDPESASGGLASVSGLILIAAAVLVMLAGVGVYLLRRG
jgi:hypothetical protein